MDIDQHVNQIVQNIVSQITTQVQSQAMAAIEQKIAEVVNAIDYTPMLASLLNQKIEARVSALPLDARTIEQELSSRVNNLAQTLSNSVKEKSLEMISESISAYTGRIDFPAMYQSAIVSAIQNKKVSFPDNSIPLDSIDISGLQISGDIISGGIIKNFGSTGIDDRATDCRLSILDEATVVENNLVTQDLTVKGTTTIEGDLNVTGSVPESSAFYVGLVNNVTNNVRTSLDQFVFKSYADLVTATIKQDGLDLNKITFNGESIVDNGALGNFITSSNLQRIGTLQELRVSGESLLSQTLYTTNKRVGINTIEPTQALSIWDQEIEIGIGKRTTNVASIDVPRNHSLIIGTNGKDNLTLLPDGSVVTNKLTVGAVTLTSSSMPPSNNAPAGNIVFNSSPTLGGPLGWISLGDARWANFGFID